MYIILLYVFVRDHTSWDMRIRVRRLNAHPIANDRRLGGRQEATTRPGQVSRVVRG